MGHLGLMGRIMKMPPTAIEAQISPISPIPEFLR